MLPAILTPVLALITEILRLINHAEANDPPEIAQAKAIAAFAALKPLRVLLDKETQDAIETLMAEMRKGIAARADAVPTEGAAS